MIQRQEGNIQEALDLFQTCTLLNPHSADNLKQVARCFFLLARHKAAIDVYEKAEELVSGDWEIAHNKAVCHLYLKDFRLAEEFFEKALQTAHRDLT